MYLQHQQNLYHVFIDFRGWSDGVIVRGKLPVPGRPTIWMIVGQGPITLAVDAGGVVWTFSLSSIVSLLFLPLSGRRSDMDWNTVSGPLNPKLPTNHHWFQKKPLAQYSMQPYGPLSGTVQYQCKSSSHHWAALRQGYKCSPDEWQHGREQQSE